MASSKALNQLAKIFKDLHQPGKPIILANVYDILSAEAVGSLESCKALATASYAVARASGTVDDDMTLETNLKAVEGIGKVALRLQKPLSVDLQDAYGAELEDAVRGVIERGAVGINLEDCDKATGKMYPIDEATSRVKEALAVAKKAGVPNFVVNARCDTLVKGGEMDEVIARGKKYLAAGATTVFVWGGSARGVSRAEVARMVHEFNGRLNVSMKMGSPDALGVSELAKIGVARISVGPAMQFMAMEYFAQKADEMLKTAHW
jgi:2-methylisocitrate lyase-like PEP mutase family enzyme